MAVLVRLSNPSDRREQRDPHADGQYRVHEHTATTDQRTAWRQASRRLGLEQRGLARRQGFEGAIQHHAAAPAAVQPGAKPDRTAMGVPQEPLLE